AGHGPDCRSCEGANRTGPGPQGARTWCRVAVGRERNPAQARVDPQPTGGAAMVKFIVVGYRRSELTREQFRRYFRATHGPLAAAIPGVRRYIQNFVEPGERRNPPWDVVVEFWFDDREAMETAWQSHEGRRATEDNSNCLDLERTRWSVVDEIVVLSGGGGRTTLRLIFSGNTGQPRIPDARSPYSSCVRERWCRGSKFLVASSIS